MEKYNLDIIKRRSEIEPIIEKSYKRLKKQIGSKIFSLLGIYGDPDNKYYIAKKYMKVFLLKRVGGLT